MDEEFPGSRKVGELSKRPRSNTWVVFLPILCWFASIVILAVLRPGELEKPSTPWIVYWFAAGFGIPFIATGIAQWRSGYLWQNLVPGNRGEHRSRNPRRFLVSTLFQFVIGAILFLLVAFSGMRAPLAD